MKKFVLLFSLFVLKADCLDEDIWNTDTTEVKEKEVSDYSICGPSKRCVPPSLCNNGKINKYGVKLIAPRSLDFDIDQCNNFEECCITDEIMSWSMVIDMPPQLNCGHRNADGVTLKLQSPKHEAEFGEFPWMMAIFKHDDYFCGGSLIHPKIVLTAAHRVLSLKTSDIKVRAGEWDRNSESEPLRHQDKSVQKIIFHRDFIHRRYHNNVALLFLESAFELRAHIAPVCLPPPDLNFDHADCFVTGWGKTKFTTKKYSLLLKKIPVQIEERSSCQRKIQATRMGPKFRLEDSQICATGKNGEDACEGDGGSPLVCPIPNTTNRYYQVGVVTAGVGCGQKDVPGIYADTAYLLPWIREQFQMDNFNLTYQP